MRVLVVEDQRDMNLLIVRTLKKAGYSVDGCYDGVEALDYLAGADYDGIVLDVMMPRMDGYTLLERLRGKGLEVPVLLLSAKDTVEDRVRGLDLGADDYLIKPFSFDELLARIRVMTRQRAGNRSNFFTVGDLVVDTTRRTCQRGGEEILLHSKEYAILEYLIRSQGAVVSREQIEDRIWNYEYAGNSNNVDVYISRLRKKIDGDREDKLIHTIRGMGWTLRAQ